MSVFTYTATREIAPGHVLDNVYSLEIRLTSFPKSIQSINKQNVSISGNVESILYRREVSYTVTTEVIEPRSQKEYELVEFFASVLNGEPFVFDRYGTIAVPDRAVTCILISDSLDAEEVGKLYHRYRLQFREA